MKYLIAYIWAIIWGGIMFVLMTLPSRNLEGTSLFEGFDKLAHCGTFFVLTALLYWESLLKSKWTANKWLTVLKIVIATGLFALATEAAQKYFSPTRMPDIWDIFADMVGVGMATFAYILFYKRTEK